MSVDATALNALQEGQASGPRGRGAAGTPHNIALARARAAVMLSPQQVRKLPGGHYNVFGSKPCIGLTSPHDVLTVHWVLPSIFPDSHCSIMLTLLCCAVSSLPGAGAHPGACSRGRRLSAGRAIHCSTEALCALTEDAGRTGRPRAGSLSAAAGSSRVSAASHAQPCCACSSHARSATTHNQAARSSSWAR